MFTKPQQKTLSNSLLPYKNSLLLLLSHFSRVRLCATPHMAAHQAPLSLGFSRQEYWSGLPFPSPMDACMLSRFSHVQLCETLWTAVLQAPLSTGFSRQEYWSGLPSEVTSTIPVMQVNKLRHGQLKSITQSYTVSKL